MRNNYITSNELNTRVNLKSVSDIGLGLTHPRRTKLQHETFLRFGHPRLEFENLSKTPCY